MLCFYAVDKMKPSKLPVAQRAGVPASSAPPSEAYSDYDEFSSREGIVNVDGLKTSYNEAAQNDEISQPPMESPSQSASAISKRFSQKDLKSTFKRHVPRVNNPLAPDPQNLHPPTFHDYQMRVAELESQNAFLRFKLRLQLNDADAAEKEVSHFTCSYFVLILFSSIIEPIKLSLRTTPIYTS